MDVWGGAGVMYIQVFLIWYTRIIAGNDNESDTDSVEYSDVVFRQKKQCKLERPIYIVHP